MVWDLQLSLKLLFRDILRMICNIDFKCGIINFCKQRKCPVKYQHLGVAPLILPPHFSNILRCLIELDI